MIGNRTPGVRALAVSASFLLAAALGACGDSAGANDRPDAGGTPDAAAPTGPDAPTRPTPTPIEDLTVNTGVSDDGPTAGEEVQVFCTVEGLAVSQEEPATRWEVWKSPQDLEQAPEIDGDMITFFTTGEYQLRCIIEESEWIDPTPAKVNVHAGKALEIDTHVDPTTIPAGSLADVECLGEDEYGNTIRDDWEILVTPAGPDPGIEGGIVEANQRLKGITVGTYDVACKQKGGETDGSPVNVEVEHGQPYRIVTGVGQEAFVAGSSTSVSCHAEDRQGNVVPDLPMNIDLPTKLTLQGFDVTGTVSGKYTVKCVPAQLDWNLFSLEHANVEILPGAPVDMDASLQPPKPFFGTYEQFKIVVVAFDRYDNPIPDVEVEPITVTPDADFKELVGQTLLIREEGEFTLHVALLEDPSIWEDIDVRVDGAPPTVQVTSPRRGATVRNAKPSVTIEGTAHDAITGIGAVTVNGKPATLYEDGTWSTILIPKWGLNVIEVTAEDLAEETTTVTQSFYFAELYYGMDPSPEMIPDAIKVWLDDQFIDDGDHNPTQPNDIATLMEGAIASFDVSDALPSGVDVGSNYELSMRNFTMNPPSLYLDPFDGGINMDIEVKNVRVRVKLEGECKVLGIDLCPDFSGSVKVGLMQMDADLLASAVKGNMEIGLANPSVTLKALDVDIDGILGWLFGWLIDFLVDMFTDTIAEAFEDQVGDILEDTLSEVVEALAITETFEIESPMPGVIGDLALTLDSKVWSLSFTEEGGRLGLAARLDTTKKIPHSILGSIARGTCVKGYPLTYSVPGQTAFEAALYDDFINEALAALWYQGVMDIFLDQETLGELMGDEGDDAFPIPVDDMSIAIDFLLPPILNGCDPSGVMKFQTGDIFVDMQLVSPLFDGGRGDIGVYVSLEASTEIVVTDTDEGPAIGLLFHGIDHIWYQWEYVPELFEDTSILEELIEDQLLGPALEDLGNEPLGNIVVPQMDLGELTPLFSEGTFVNPQVDDLLRDNGHTLFQGHLD